MLFNVFEPKLVDSLLYAMIEFFNHGIQGTATWSQLSLVPLRCHSADRAKEYRKYVMTSRKLVVSKMSNTITICLRFKNILAQSGIYTMFCSLVINNYVFFSFGDLDI